MSADCRPNIARKLALENRQELMLAWAQRGVKYAWYMNYLRETAFPGGNPQPNTAFADTMDIKSRIEVWH